MQDAAIMHITPLVALDTPTGASIGTKQGFQYYKITGTGSAAHDCPHGLLDTIPDFRDKGIR